MNTIARLKSNPVPLKVHRLHYLRIGTKINYTPCRDDKGIHCTGDKFDYIVPWQIDDKKKAKYMAEFI